MKKWLLIAWPLLAAASPLWGQSVDNQQADEIVIAEPRPEIVVTGLPIAAGDAAYAINVIPLQTGARLENSLRNVAGLQQFRRSDARSSSPTSQGITMRGLGGNASSRVLLTLDGVPQSDPFGGWVSWPAYDAIPIDAVRVKRGGGAGADGPGALAGTIELFSASRSDFLNLEAAYGSRSSMEAKAALSRGLGEGRVTVSGSYARGDGFIPIIKSQRGAADRPAPYEQAGMALRAVAPISDNTKLQANLHAFTDQRERGFAFSDNQNSGVDASLQIVNRDYNGWQWSALGYVQMRNFASRFGGVSDDRSSAVLTLDQYAVPSTGLGARFEMRPPLGDRAELRIGGDWRRTSGVTKENFFFTGTVPGRSRTAGGRTDTLGAFAELTLLPTDTLTLTAGGRADHWSITRGYRREINIGGTLAGSVRSDDRFANRSGWEGTGRAGIAFDASNTIKLRAAAYMGWRLPTLNELYRPFRAGADATAANEALSPERLKGAEIGAQYSDGDYKISATAFVNRLDGAIANVTQGRGPGIYPGVGFVAAGGTYRRRQNLDRINSKGIEVDVKAYILSGVKLRAGYAYVDAKVAAPGMASALNGLRPAQVPQHFANAGVDYRNGNFELGADLRYTSRQFEDDANTRALGAAVTVDANATYRIGGKVRVEMRAENIMNKAVAAAISSNGVTERTTPRTVWFGVSFGY